MKIVFPGCGSAFSKVNGQNNALIADEENMKVLAIDCGGQHAMKCLELFKNLKGEMFDGVPYHKVITDIWISHLHGDHTAGLEELGFCCRFDPSADRPNLYGHHFLLEKMWNESLRGGMGSLDYGQLTPEEEEHGITLASYFHPKRLSDNETFKIGDTTLTPFQSTHVSNNNVFMPCWGLLVTTYLGQRIMFTADTQFFPEQLISMYSKADVIFHDCETMGWNIEKKEKMFGSRVHAHYGDLRTLPKEVKAKMWLMHYNDGELPNAKKDGFLGFVKPQQEFLF
jgi:ribonuclease BN (tRNA processing enzyme)